MKWVLVGAAVWVLGTLLAMWLGDSVNATAHLVAAVATATTGSLLFVRGVD